MKTTKFYQFLIQMVLCLCMAVGTANSVSATTTQPQTPTEVPAEAPKKGIYHFFKKHLTRAYHYVTGTKPKTDPNKVAANPATAAAGSPTKKSRDEDEDEGEKPLQSGTQKTGSGEEIPSADISLKDLREAKAKLKYVPPTQQNKFARGEEEGRGPGQEKRNLQKLSQTEDDTSEEGKPAKAGTGTRWERTNDGQGYGIYKKVGSGTEAKSSNTKGYTGTKGYGIYAKKGATSKNTSDDEETDTKTVGKKTTKNSPRNPNLSKFDAQEGSQYIPTEEEIKKGRSKLKFTAPTEKNRNARIEEDTRHPFVGKSYLDSQKTAGEKTFDDEAAPTKVTVGEEGAKPFTPKVTKKNSDTNQTSSNSQKPSGKKIERTVDPYGETIDFDAARKNLRKTNTDSTSSDDSDSPSKPAPKRVRFADKPVDQPKKQNAGGQPLKPKTEAELNSTGDEDSVPTKSIQIKAGSKDDLAVEAQNQSKKLNKKKWSRPATALDDLDAYTNQKEADKIEKGYIDSASIDKPSKVKADLKKIGLAKDDLALTADENAEKLDKQLEEEAKRPTRAREDSYPEDLKIKESKIKQDTLYKNKEFEAAKKAAQKKQKEADDANANSTVEAN